MAKPRTKRSDELSTRPLIKKHLLDVYKDIEKGYVDQCDRSDDNSDYWDIWNCKLGERQFYSGNSKIFLPIVKDAVNARKTRFVNQLFPQAGRFVEVTTQNGDIPHATMSLLEHYVQACKLRTKIVPALTVNGDIEGQYSVYVSWRETERNVVSRRKEKVKVDDVELEGDDIETVEEEVITDGKPHVEVINDSDLLVLPATCDSIDDALEEGGSVTIIRRWSKTRLKKMMRDGEITREEGNAAVKEMTKDSKGNSKANTRKDQADAAGIRSEGVKYMQGYETWTKLKVDGEYRLCRIYYGGEQQILGAKLNPYWCDRVPVISAPLEKMSNVFKGRSKIADVIDTQIFANDTVNEGADTAHFSAMPIIMTDPEKNPKVASMILGLASVWETSPNDTQFAKFPELWKSSFEIVANCKSQIFQTLSVTPAMMPQSTGGRQKRNQAEIAAEQQADLLQTADATINISEAILTPLIQRFAEYDHQFRDKAITVRKFGEMGLKANMEDIPPIEANNRWSYRWSGVETNASAQRIQQQIAAVNVMRGIPPQLYEGYKLKLSPFLVVLAESAFGPQLGPLVFEDMTKQLSVDPEMENQMLEGGFDVAVHPSDNDIEHMQAHMQAMADGDPSGMIRTHMIKHQGSMQQKTMQQQQMMQQMGGTPGEPGGAGPGLPGAGAQPGQPRGAKGPPGMVNPDQMQGMQPPRKT